PRPLRGGLHAVRKRHHPRREGRSRQGARVNAAATRAVAMLGALALWAAVTHGNAWFGVVNSVLLPTPVEVGRVALDLAASGELTRHFVTSLGRVAQGFGLATLAAVVLRPPPLVNPVGGFGGPSPPLAFLPMFLVWFGLGEASKIAFIGYTTFFPMFVAITPSVMRVRGVL